MISAAATLYMKASVERIAALQFTSHCHEMQNTITEKLADYALLLQSGVGLFNAYEVVTREEWRLFTKSHKIEKQLPGILGLGFSLLIPPAELTRHTHEIRSEGFPEYTLRPGGDRGIYSSIIYLEPFSGRNLLAFGYDMLSEPVRRAAMERARDTDAAALSGKVVLVQETSTEVQAGTLMYAPVYRKGMPIETVEQRRAAIYGWVYSPYRMNDLMQEMLAGFNLEKQIHIQVFDGEQPAPESLLYESRFAGEEGVGPRPVFSRQTLLDFNGHRWTMRFTKNGGGLFTLHFMGVWLTMVGSTLITVLLFALIWTLLNTRAEALRMVEERTAELQETEEVYRTVADYTYDWEYWAAPDGTLRYLSPSCEGHTGYRSAEFQQDSGLMQRITHPDDWNQLADHLHFALDAARQANQHQMDFRITTRRGEERWFAHVCQAVYDGDGKYLGQRACNRDITDRKQAEAQIIQLNFELEQRVINRTAQLAAANQELEAFCYSVSHDLRAPLRHIDGYVELLVSRYRDHLTDKGLHYLETIADSARQMGVLIDDLLQFSRTGRVNCAQERMDMNQVLQETLTILQEANAGRTIAWEIKDLPPVRGDCALLRQVWMNLLGNAIKYTRPRETARIEVSAREENGEIIFAVQDNGVGFDMQYVGKLFGVFQRLHSQEQFEGTGIGLATVQRIINRHGGRVWAEAELGRGATFYFTLPTLKEAQHA